MEGVFSENVFGIDDVACAAEEFSGEDGSDELFGQEEVEKRESREDGLQGDPLTDDERESGDGGDWSEDEKEGEEELSPSEEGYVCEIAGKSALLSKDGIESVAQSMGIQPSEVVEALSKGGQYDNVKGMLDAESEMMCDVARRFGVKPRDVGSFLLSLADTLNGAGGARSDADIAQPRYGGGRGEQDFDPRDSRRPWVDFFIEHPEVTPDNIESEMLEDVKMGMSPREAYLSQKLRESEFLLKREKKLSENRVKSIGRMSGEVSAGGKDAFEKAFDSVFGG